MNTFYKDQLLGRWNGYPMEEKLENGKTRLLWTDEAMEKASIIIQNDLSADSELLRWAKDHLNVLKDEALKDPTQARRQEVTDCAQEIQGLEKTVQQAKDILAEINAIQVQEGTIPTTH